MQGEKASEMEVSEEKVNELFENAMKGRWDTVLDDCAKNSKVREAKLTKSEDTALHIAVYDGREDIVRKLVDSIPQEDAFKILNIKNDGGNTPLHLAAALGNVGMCWCIARRVPSLISTRNDESETPLFLAACHGKQQAFLCLYEHCKPDYTTCRKNNGDTILHSAIYGEYLSLAFQIISYYPDLVNSMNENGLSPLHILASKPNIFRSSSRPRLFDRIIYHCAFFDELKEESHDHETCLNNSEGDNSARYPENYRTCTDIFKLLGVSFRVLTSGNENNTWKLSLRLCWDEFRNSLHPARGRNKNGGSADEENPPKKSNISQGEGMTPTPTPPNAKSSGSNSGENVVKSSSNVQRSEPYSGGNQARKEDKSDHPFPSNYSTCVLFFTLVMKALLIILGFGFGRIKKIQEKKTRHKWAFQIMNELVERASTYKYNNNGRRPPESLARVIPEVFPAPPDDISQSKETNNGISSASQNKDEKEKDQNESEKRDTPILVAAKMGVTEIVDKFLATYPAAIQELNSAQKNLVLLTFEKKQTHDVGKKESAILIATKMGITEMVEKILDTFPVAIHDLDSNKKNVVLLAVENRQTQVYNLLLKKTLKESVFRQVDDQGNSALHLAATFGEHQPWLIPGAALQMQWEFKWYKFVKHSMGSQFFVRYNNRGETPREIFTRTHKDLVKSGSEWLTKTSESCSVVAALIATVAFATSSTVPGGIDDKTGTPVLESQPAFDAFAISSLVALCFSVTALVFFLAILTSRCQEEDFSNNLPRKLLLGLTSLFTSIASMLISFCAGHFFVLKDKLKYAAFPVYAVTCLPVTFFAFAQIPLYFDLIWAILTRVPQRSYKVFAH